uniref:S-methyl-5-thioribose-1-phosphate isomerase n=1 Tax=Panagrolaimus sp. JU765 TaxID=591449 RepID=A0AC34QV48_9BILA
MSPWPELNIVQPNLINKPVGKVINFDEKLHSWDNEIENDRKIHSIIYNHKNKTLKILDQLKIPDETIFVDILSTEDAYDVIKKMQVRGAPLIATVGTLAFGIELEKNLTMNYDDLIVFIEKQATFLKSSRPTAVNLRNAFLRIGEIVRVDQEEKEKNSQRLIIKIQDAAYKWFLDERAENDLLIRNSVICLEANVPSNEKLTVMTICNTGSLATSSHGTALGVIRKLYLRNRLQLAFILETRPYNQGSRLTAYECVKEGIPFKLITDSMAAAAMKTYKIDAVLVGADQVAQNGDTANKIGTYMLAVLANFHKIPFYVVTPTESINPRIESGDSIKIEERPAHELVTFNGKATAPEGTQVWNPAFDVTPGYLITGILTENGNIVPGQHSVGSLSSQSRIEN